MKRIVVTQPANQFVAKMEGNSQASGLSSSFCEAVGQLVEECGLMDCLTVQSPGDDHHYAWVQGRPDTRCMGTSRREAIGNLVQFYGKAIGIEVIDETNKK